MANNKKVFHRGKAMRLPKWEEFDAAIVALHDCKRKLAEQRNLFDEFNGLISAFLVQLLGERGEAVFDKATLSDSIRKYHSEVIPEGDSYRVRLRPKADFDAQKVKENIQTADSGEQESELDGGEEAVAEQGKCGKCSVCKFDKINET